MSRPLKLKVTGAALYRLSNSPTWVYRACLRGRTANVFSRNPIEEPGLIPLNALRSTCIRTNRRIGTDGHAWFTTCMTITAPGGIFVAFLCDSGFRSPCSFEEEYPWPGYKTMKSEICSWR